MGRESLEGGEEEGSRKMELAVGASTRSSLEKLRELISGSWDHTLDRDVRQDIKTIVDHLDAALNNPPTKGGSHGTEFRDVAYEAEDCADHIRLRLRRQQPSGAGGLVSALRRAWFLTATRPVRRSIPAQIHGLRDKAQLLVPVVDDGEGRERSNGNHQLLPGDDAGGSGPLVSDLQGPVEVDRAVAHAHLRPLLTASVQNPVGIEQAMADIRPWFTACEQDPELRVLAIHGCEGIGKTTLAKALHREFGGRFDSHATVLASRCFSVGAFLQSLLKQIMTPLEYGELQLGSSYDGWKDDELQEKVEEQFLNKRCIVIIEDVWSVPSWKSIRRFLPVNSMGSRIIVTTRFPSVAQAICHQQDFIYACNPLNVDDSHSLLERTLGADNQFPLRADSSASRRILEKCGGLPLAIILVASLLADRLTSDSSLARACDSIISELENSGTHHEEITKRIFHLCFSDLPGDLKTCLLTLCMFPAGFTISRKRLISRWKVEGFIAERHPKTIEQVGEEAFNELVRRNMIKPVETSNNGRVIKTFQVHDLILENIVSISREENFITVMTDGCSSTGAMQANKVRWLSIHRSSSPLCAEVTKTMNLLNVRSLTAFGTIKHLGSLAILQVLDLEGCRDLGADQLSEICKLYLLKYLSLRRTYIKTLPCRIGRLQYLETLDIRDTNIQRLPRSACQLKRMVHLLSGDKKRGLKLQFTKEITEMSELQTLSGVDIIFRTSRAALEGTRNLKKLSKIKLRHNRRKWKVYFFTSSLRYLAIDAGSFTASFNLPTSPAAYPYLHTFKLSGKLYGAPQQIFTSMPGLEQLTLPLISLRTDLLQILSKLPKLSCLTFSMDPAKLYPDFLVNLQENVSESGGEIFVPAGGFDCLHTLRFSGVGLPLFSFLQGAMTWLQRLELRFRMLDGIYGLENLESLHMVHLEVSKQASQVTEEKVKQIEISVEKHPKGPAIICDKYSE